MFNTKSLCVFLLLLLMAVPAFAAPTNFESVLTKQGVSRDNQLGLEILSRFTMRDCKGKSCQVSAYFYGANGQPLVDTDGLCKSANGKVSVGTTFVVSSDYDLVDTSTNPSFILFIPYSQLHLPAGTHNLTVLMETSSDGQFLGASNPATFSYTQP